MYVGSERDGKPSIAAGVAKQAVTINPHNFEPGEAEQVAVRLAEVLSGVAQVARPARGPALATV